MALAAAARAAAVREAAAPAAVVREVAALEAAAGAEEAPEAVVTAAGRTAEAAVVGQEEATARAHLVMVVAVATDPGSAAVATDG